MAPGSTTGSVTGGESSGDGMKVGAPGEFTGVRNYVETLILQCRLIFAMELEKLTCQQKRMMYIISYMKDLRSSSSNLTSRITWSIRTSLRNNSDQLSDMATDNGRAERALQALRQRGSAAKYKAEFQILSAKLDWNDGALAAQF
ncbi:hypothetical protein LTR56_025965 [Elasticomyces elasticus]|nr:hypothetical protein LTR56_025965 [Elasticomyces elasticus]KAK3618389.1 hypothetical protein LTR22_026394 [Elasticomyces elasticus]